MVLVILAVVATVAVQALQPKVDSARLQQTSDTLSQVKLAVAGSVQSDGQQIISQGGFVADMGRLPSGSSVTIGNPLQLQLDPTSETHSAELSELWDDQSPLALQYPYQFRSGPKSPVDLSDIQLACGWRGPYLDLPVGSGRLTDAWNRNFELLLTPAGHVGRLRWRPLDFYADDQPEVEVNLADSLVAVAGRLQFEDGAPSQVNVYLLAPDPEVSLAELNVLQDEDPQTLSFLFNSVPIGMRAIRVEYDGNKFTRYIQVPAQGLTTLFEISSTE